MNLSNFLKNFILSHRNVGFFVALGICSLLYGFQGSLPPPEMKIVSVPKARTASFFKLITFGYWPAATDWMWIETLQISGGQNFSETVKPHAIQFYELATDLDPRFFELYEQSGVLFSFFFKSPNDSIHFLKKGTSVSAPGWKRTYTLYLLMAYVYAYELGDWEKAKEAFLRASEIPGSPDYLQKMKTWLNEEGSEKILAKRVLSMLIQQTDDPALKATYQERLKNL